ncbi:hypothetical protein [Micromonospora sp. NPDC047738]|uniref:hypothetical protein n=1 Tax=unclassified Micromonospora TaxID=2617518 RepID=UPI0033CD0027
MHDKFLTIRQGSESTLHTASHNLPYRALRHHEENLLSLRNHLLSTPFQRRFDSHHRESLRHDPQTGVAATSDETDDEVADRG